ncbi:MAG TPA: hypothetical protein VKM55_16840 [Candidatus Lokiarchaeia archaeon]|nr:hypothetical protein [Candidatus Lokiarchaeia archaeon]
MIGSFLECDDRQVFHRLATLYRFLWLITRFPSRLGSKHAGSLLGTMTKFVFLNELVGVQVSTLAEPGTLTVLISGFVKGDVRNILKDSRDLNDVRTLFRGRRS